MLIKRILLTSLYSLIILACTGQRPEFFKEQVILELDTLYLSVNGDFYFRNPSPHPVTIPVRFPVMKTGLRKVIDTILVYDVSAPQALIPVEIMDTVASFSITIPDSTESQFKVMYRQRHNGKVARYILRTGKEWPKPLEAAIFTLVADKTININAFSYYPDKSENDRKAMIYSWTMRDFKPDKDFEVFFETVRRK